MIKAFLIVLVFGVWATRCSQPDQAVSIPAAAPVDTVAVASVDFARDIQPILVSNCSPCHFEGGKMYARMPFDKPQTIRDHPEGVMRRIKGEEEVKKLKAFLGSTAD